MRTVIQIAPEIGTGSGVGGVAANLEREWQRRGVTTLRFTMAEARGGWFPKPGPGVSGKFVLAARVMWFSTVGTVLARRFVRRHPEAVAVCHNDALAGDVYINHGNVHAAMAARGGRLWRTARNPLHIFTGVRDALRYGTHTHRAVVNLTSRDERDLRRIYPRLAVPTHVVGNGVDVDHFTPPTPEQRADGRAGMGFDDDDFVIVFVGHEFDRKGLPVLLDAIVEGPPSWQLLVVGGTDAMVATLRQSSSAVRLAERLHTVGRVDDARPYLHIADVFAFPSAYEAYQLVVLEALACGVPVVASPSGCVPDLIENGVNGQVVTPRPDEVRRALVDVQSNDRDRMRDAARRCALSRSWGLVAEEYLELLRPLRGAGGRGAPR